MMNRRNPLVLVLGLLAAPAAARAQEPAPPRQLIDAIAAVVGDSIVLNSELEEEVLRMAAASGQPAPRDPAVRARIRQQLLESKINELLLVQAAERDTAVTVADEEVREAVEREFGQRQANFASPQEFEQALRQAGLTLASYRGQLTRDLRRQRLVQQYMARVQRERKSPPVTEDEIRAFFEAQKEQLGERPATVAFRQVVVAPRPSDSARVEARKKAEDILSQIRAGEDFTALARRHSEDPGSREKGGDLGWFRAGAMVKPLEEAVFGMRPGEVSGIVESSFGFHIIKLERIKGAERQARHILIRPAVAEEDAQRTRALADEIAAKILGGASMDSLATAHHDTEEQAKVGPFPKDRLPEPYNVELASAKVGDVLGPLVIPGTGGSEKWAVVKVTEVTEAGEYTLEDPATHAMVRQQLEQQKLIEELVKELRQRTYVDVRS